MLNIWIQDQMEASFLEEGKTLSNMIMICIGTIMMTAPSLNLLNTTLTTTSQIDSWIITVVIRLLTLFGVGVSAVLTYFNYQYLLTINVCISNGTDIWRNATCRDDTRKAESIHHGRFQWRRDGANISDWKGHGNYDPREYSIWRDGSSQTIQNHYRKTEKRTKRCFKCLMLCIKSKIL